MAIHELDSSSVAQFEGDLRGQAVEQRRDKERRVRYRNVNVNLLGKPVGFPYNTRSSDIWNDKNKFKMPGNRSCRCSYCRPIGARGKRRAALADVGDVPCTSRKRPLPSLKRDSGDSSDYDSVIDDDCTAPDEHILEVTYTFDNQRGPRTEESLSYAVTEAVKRFQNRELAALIKNEYEVIAPSDSEEDFEFI